MNEKITAIMKGYDDNNEAKKYYFHKDSNNKITNSITKETHMEVIFHESRKQFIRYYYDKDGILRQRILKGLHAFAKTIGWSQYSQQRQFDKTFLNQSRKRKRSSFNTFGPPGLHTPFQGTVLGTIVHEQFRSIIQCKNMEQYSQIHGTGMHPITSTIINCLIHKNILPIDSEQTVWNPEKTIATRCDIIGTDGNFIYIIELKTGYKNYFNTEVHDIKGQIITINNLPGNLPSTPLNHAKLQCAMTTLLFQHSYNVSPEKCKSVVLHIDDSKASWNLISNKFITTFATPFLSTLTHKSLEKN